MKSLSVDEEGGGLELAAGAAEAVPGVLAKGLAAGRGGTLDGATGEGTWGEGGLLFDPVFLKQEKALARRV